MSGRYDVAVVGGGHNGLAAAFYLARAGRSVVVLERAEKVGGTAATRELAPGCRGSAAFQSCELLDPIVVKQLGLRGRLKRSAPGGTALAMPEGVLRFDGKGRYVPVADGASGPRLAEKDIVRLRELEHFLQRLVAVLSPLYRASLPEVERLATRDKLDLLRVGWRLRRLGRRDMHEAMRLLPMSMRDLAEERLEGGPARALLAGLGSAGGWLGPYDAGSVFRALHDQMLSPRPLFAGPVFPRGGMGAVAEALAAAAGVAGAEVRTGAEVRRIEVDGGSVAGVTLASGDHIEADLVLADADPRQTLLRLVDPRALDPDLVFAARSIRARAGVAVVSFVLDRLPAVRGQESAEEALRGRVQIGATVADIGRAFDDAPAGKLPARPFVQLLFPTLEDPELTDDERHLAVAWVQSVPRWLAAGSAARATGGSADERAAGEGAGDATSGGGGDDGWSEGRDALARATLAVIEEALPGFHERVQQYDVAAPPDFEARHGAGGGCLYDADIALDQALYLRPLPGWYDYAMAVDGLYLCGSGTHGGGGITGLPGRNAAQRVLADLAAQHAQRNR